MSTPTRTPVLTTATLAEAIHEALSQQAELDHPADSTTGPFTYLYDIHIDPNNPHVLHIEVGTPADLTVLQCFDLTLVQTGTRTLPTLPTLGLPNG
jgi:hypothetical protein